MSDSPAETLRRAAKLMREQAQAAQVVVPGPWHHQSLGWGYPQPIYNSEGDLVAEGYSGPVTATDVAQYIASWHPAVALAVTDWLESCANDADGAPVVGGEPASAYCDEPGSVHRALKVARTYLGEST